MAQNLNLPSNTDTSVEEYAEQLSSIPQQNMPLIIGMDDAKWAEDKINHLLNGVLPESNIFVAVGNMDENNPYEGYTPILATNQPGTLLIELAGIRLNSGETTILLEDFDLADFDPNLNMLSLLKKLKSLGVVIAIVSRRPGAAFDSIKNGLNELSFSVYDRETEKLYIPRDIDEDYEEDLEEYKKSPKTLKGFVNLHLGVEE